MKKFKLFIGNFLIYGLGGVLSKIVPLIMLPLITRLMPDTFYFGLNDLSNIVVSFGSSIAIMGMYDAMFRMFFEKEDLEYKKQICSSALIFTMVTSVLLFLILVIFRKPIGNFVFSDASYGNLLILTAMSILIGSTNSIVAAPTRMQNKRGVFLILNTLSPIISYSVSVPLLIKGYWIIALPLAGVISAFSLEVTFFILNKDWFKLRYFNKGYLVQMIKIAIPLLPNFLIYWVFNSSDRLMIAKLINNQATGIYAIGAKLGQVSQLIYTAFAGGWQYFAFSTMKEDNQVKTNSVIFEYLGAISFAAGMFMCAMSKWIFSIFFEGDYVLGYIVAPYLFLAPLLQMLYQVAANQFLIIKKTWPNMVVLSVGAVLNIIINFILIPLIGIEGAAIATLLGYAVADILCVVVLCRMKLMIVSKRFLNVTFLMLVYIIIWRLLTRENPIISLLFAIIISSLYITMYLKDITNLVKGFNMKKNIKAKN